MALIHLIKKGAGAVKWLDGIPSVPAAAGAFMVGLITPNWVLVLVVIGIIAYTVIKYNDK